MTVTLIVPAVNAAPTISRTLASLTAQTIPDLEIVIVDKSENECERDARTPFVGRSLKADQPHD